jgi:hypothetical protein
MRSGGRDATLRGSPNTLEFSRLDAGALKVIDLLLRWSGNHITCVGLWSGWRGLRTKSGVAVPGPARANAITSAPENQDWNFRLSDMLYSPIVAGESSPNLNLTSDNKTRTPTIQTVPQSLLPSKLRRQTAKRASRLAPSSG